MNHIFISYRWGDRKSDDDFREFVNVIEHSTSLTAFWDTRELRSGNFINKLQEGVKNADIFMPVVTKSYIAFGKEGGRDEDKDFCLLEYATAVSAGKKIVPIFCGVAGNIKTISCDDATAVAERVLNLSYSTDDVAVLQKYLCSQNGVTISNVDAEQISKNADRLCSIVFDTFCNTESDITFYKKHLDDLATRLDPIRIFGDFDDSGLTLSNSYVPLSFLRNLTEKERKEKENSRESTAPTDAGENTLLTNLKNEKLAVIVGDAGQGKSSFVRHLTIQLAEQAKQNGLSCELFFPLYFECKNIDRNSMSSYDEFLNELAGEVRLSRPALDAVMRWGKPLYIFDAMDEIPPDHMDALIDAIYKHIYIQNNKTTYFLFTSRPGQRLVSGRNDFSLSHDNKSVVRKYSVKEFDESQQELYIDNLAKAKKAGSDIKNTFLQALQNKETAISDYRSISRNPFMLFAIFSTYTNGQDLPENRFDAISRVIDDIIERDLKKQDYSPINKKNIKEILGAVSCLFYQQRDIGKTPHASMQTPYDLAEKIYHLDDSDRDDRKLLNKYSEFFGKSNLLDENGFRHEFLAATYAAYYLLFLMKSKVKKEKSPLEVNDLSSLKKDTDYWKGVTEALLCLIDRESEDSKTYIEPLIDELQNTETPDYDTLCSAVSQFVNHQPRAATLLLTGMLERGCDGIEYGEQTNSGFICHKGINPYEELFYYPAIYPYLQQYLSNLTTGAKEDEEKYLCSELIKEVCALFSDEYYQKLQNVYKCRSSNTYPNIIKKLADAADRRDRNIHGYVRLRNGEPKIGDGAFGGYTSLTGITIPDSVTEIKFEAFSNCTGLTSITIPSSVTEIEGYAFFNCTGLTGINVCDNNPYYSSINGVLFNKEKTSIILYPAGKTGTYTIPYSVTEIGMWAFAGTSLTSITIPTKMTKIGIGAFSGCTELTSVTIPDSVTEIGYATFSFCLELAGITIPDSVTEIGRWAFFGCTKLTIHGKKDSYAEKYAKENNIPFVAE